MRFNSSLVIAALLFAVSASSVSAHPGRTDSNSGHTCRTNCAQWGLQDGEYHYPNGGGAPAQVAPQEAATVAPVVQTQRIAPTVAPVKRAVVIPTQKPSPTAIPYKETDMDKKKLFKVVKIIDGDTIEVNIRGRVETVRLLGIDTPETVDPRKSVQCFGKEASNKLQLVLQGKYVKLVDDRSQGNRDKYKRLLRYVYLDKVFINAEMVKQGYAFSYKEYPTKYLNDFNSYEKQAREKNVGLWRSCGTNTNKTITTPTKTAIKPTVKPRQVTSTPQKVQAAPVQVGVSNTGGDKDCGDFSTHAQAQAFFESAGAGDPHRLDRDGDGSACETLP